MAGLTPEEVQYMEEHASDNVQPNLIATCVLCLFFPCVAVLLRFIARWRTRSGYGLDDWLIVGALIPMMGMTITTSLTVRYGEGRHIIFIKNAQGFAEAYVGGVVAYALTSTCIKFSVLALYYRIFQTRTMYILSWCVAGLVLAYNTALIIFDFLQCIPLSMLWSDAGGSCTSTTPAYVTLAVMNVVTDIMILTLPIKNVVGLQMETTRKLQVIGVFGLGGVVCIFGIIRSYYVSQANVEDETWTAAPGAIWSQVEIAVGIVSACLPIYRPLFLKRSQLSKSSYSDPQRYERKPESKGLQLANRSIGGSDWTARSKTLMDNDTDDRPFVLLQESDGLGAGDRAKRATA